MGGVGGARARRVADHRRAQGDYVEERGHSRRFGSAVAATWREGEMWVGKGWKLEIILLGWMWKRFKRKEKRGGFVSVYGCNVREVRFTS
eukprot:scaffold5343_cov48-Phaeocystis_antarctica.AAC.6